MGTLRTTADMCLRTLTSAFKLNSFPGLFMAVGLLFFFPFIIQPATAAGAKPKVIMIIINRVSLEDLTDTLYPGLQELLSLGSLGLVALNSSGEVSDSSAYVTLGSGEKIAGLSMAGASYGRDELMRDGANAYQVYRRNMGISSGDSQLLNVSLPALLKLNQKNYNLGLLGGTLHNLGLKTAVMGNSDFTPSEPPNRLAVLVAMDELGRADYGSVGRELLRRDPFFSFGWRTDYQKLGSRLNEVLAESDFIVVETGDTFRANAACDQELKKMNDYHRRSALLKADGFIKGILPFIDNNNMVMVVTPVPGASAVRAGVRLTPLIIAGGKMAPGGILWSASTRQEGLVAGADIAATIINHLGGQEVKNIPGLALGSFKSLPEKQTPFVGDIYNRLTMVSNQRAKILNVFIKYQWAVYALALLQFVFRRFFCFGIVRGLLTGVLIFPVMILLMPFLQPLNIWLVMVLLLLSVGSIAFMMVRSLSNLSIYIAVAAFNVIPSILDVFTGQHLMKRAALSYDLVVGGRFYGIGNEYMGVVIGAAILGAAALLQLVKHGRVKYLIFIGMFFLILDVFFAAPFAGTNAGGALAGVTGFITAMYSFCGKKLHWRAGILFFGSLIIGLAILVVMNSMLSTDTASHIGRSINSLISGNLYEIWQTVLRKLLANAYLVQHSPITIIIILQLLMVFVLYCRNSDEVRNILRQKPFLRAGALGMLSGALAAFIFNDSGLIAAALLLNYMVGPLIMEVLECIGSKTLHSK